MYQLPQHLLLHMRKQNDFSRATNLFNSVWSLFLIPYATFLLRALAFKALSLLPLCVADYQIVFSHCGKWGLLTRQANPGLFNIYTWNVTNLLESNNYYLIEMSVFTNRHVSLVVIAAWSGLYWFLDPIVLKHDRKRYCSKNIKSCAAEKRG